MGGRKYLGFLPFVNGAKKRIYWRSFLGDKIRFFMRDFFEQKTPYF
jgi:hypothetical protein